MSATFEASKTEYKFAAKIAKRAVELGAKSGVKVDYTTMEMDIIACHVNGCPLDLEKLLGADDFNFSHDVFGIRRHIDRETGELGNCFLPRCADHE
jgi:hypothetical protein